jgi:DNA-binding NtrC family response regulator
MSRFVQHDGNGPTLRGETEVLSEAQRGYSVLCWHRGLARVGVLKEGGTLVVGRGESADLTVPESKVSREHVRLSCLDGAVTVEDLGSTNGTLVNGERVEQGRIDWRDTVVIGPIRITIYPLEGLPEVRDDHDFFLSDLQNEVQRARYFQREGWLLLLRFEHPVSSEQVASVEVELREVDRCCRYSEQVLEVLLLEASATWVDALAHRLIRLPRGPRRASLVGFPAAGTSAQALLEKGLESLHCVPDGEIRVVAQGEDVPVGGSEPGVVIASSEMKALYEVVPRAAASDLPVLLHGETGTGKELLARAIHRQSARRSARLLCVNCAAIAQSLLESTLFGHERGAFTGATQRRAGIFEAATGGTVFLDEIGELSSAAQAALLRVLENGTVLRVGATTEIAVDVRLIAASNRNLEALSASGTFRADLFYRLNTFLLHIPPLRSRREEIGPLVEYFIRRANARHGRAIQGVDPEAARLLHAYRWPGNVRELKNAIERAVAVATGRQIAGKHLPQAVWRADVQRPTRPGGNSVQALAGSKDDTALRQLDSLDLRASLQRTEKQLILEALRRAQGNRKQAAHLLGVPLRTLANRIAKLGIKKTYAPG